MIFSLVNLTMCSYYLTLHFFLSILALLDSYQLSTYMHLQLRTARCAASKVPSTHILIMPWGTLFSLRHIGTICTIGVDEVEGSLAKDRVSFEQLSHHLQHLQPEVRAVSRPFHSHLSTPTSFSSTSASPPCLLYLLPLGQEGCFGEFL